MSRYKLQFKQGENWVDTPDEFSTKQDLDDYIGNYNEQYEYRVGYFFKHYDFPYVMRFVWDCGKKKGEEVKPSR